MLEVVAKGFMIMDSKVEFICVKRNLNFYLFISNSQLTLINYNLIFL